MRQVKHIALSAVLAVAGLCLILRPTGFVWLIGGVCVLIGAAQLIGSLLNICITAGTVKVVDQKQQIEVDYEIRD